MFLLFIISEWIGVEIKLKKDKKNKSNVVDEEDDEDELFEQAIRNQEQQKCGSWNPKKTNDLW